MKTYYAKVGFRDSFQYQDKVWVKDDGVPDRVLSVRTPAGMHGPHSPDGHAWGYSGSGPTQLAYDILVDLVGSEIGRAVYMAFREQFIAPLDQNAGWELTEDTIRGWIAALPDRR